MKTIQSQIKQMKSKRKEGKHTSKMENHFDLRIDPRQLVPGAKTVIVLSFNYATKNT